MPDQMKFDIYAMDDPTVVVDFMNIACRKLETYAPETCLDYPTEPKCKKCGFIDYPIWIPETCGELVKCNNSVCIFSAGGWEASMSQAKEFTKNMTVDDAKAFLLSGVWCVMYNKPVFQRSNYAGIDSGLMHELMV